MLGCARLQPVNEVPNEEPAEFEKVLPVKQQAEKADPDSGGSLGRNDLADDPVGLL
jgi:hypothetical protein